MAVTIQADFTVADVLASKAEEFRMSAEYCNALKSIKLTELESEAMTLLLKNIEDQAWNDGYDDCLMEAK